MQPNSPLQPLQPMQPKVPSVPEVPDVPKVPTTPQVSGAPAQPIAEPAKPAEPPRITGISLPAGASKKAISPEQRNERIAAANAPKPKIQEKQQNLLHKPVSMEEVEEYRRKTAKRRKTIFASILLLVIVGAAATVVILAKLNQQKYQELSSVYNSNLPIVIHKVEDKDILISQTGNKLSENYDDIEDFESSRSLAFTFEDDKTISKIIDTNGNEKYSTENTLAKINGGKNFILNEDGNAYLLNQDGKKVDERPIISANYLDEQKYLLVSDSNSYAVITSEGEEKIGNNLNKNTVRAFTYAQSPYDDIYYCAFINAEKRESKLYIYNCETAEEITNIEDVYFSGGFERTDSAFLTSEKGSSFFYNNEVIYNSDTKDQEIIGGIIKKADEERYFNPITRKSTESFPTDSLIKQDKLSSKTDINENCNGYEKREASKLIKLCGRFYYNNKSLSLNYDKDSYSLLNQKLDDYLAYNDKHYIYKTNSANNYVSIIDAKSGDEVYTDVTIQSATDNPLDSVSRFVIKNNGGNKTVIDLATGKTAEYADNPVIRLEANYYIVIESNNTEYSARYFNADHEEIYKEVR